MLSLRDTKKSSRFAHKLESCLWFFIKILPLLYWVACSIASYRYSGQIQGDLSFMGTLNSIGTFGVIGNNIIFDTLADIFGSGGILPLFQTVSGGIGGFMLYMTYICACDLMRLTLYFLLFLPRLAMRWVSKAVQED